MKEELNVLTDIQTSLNAPKNLYNKFGKYHYRNCEGILEAVKPLLKKHNLSLVLSDQVRQVGEIIYVDATACLTNDNGGIIAEATAQAGIDVNKKGMDYAQAFGSSSSYARKYALNGLFLIDDVKDSDASNDHGKAPVKTTTKAPFTKQVVKAVKPVTPTQDKKDGGEGYF